jgi:hypothetical protein
MKTYLIPPTERTYRVRATQGEIDFLFYAVRYYINNADAVKHWLPTNIPKDIFNELFKIAKGKPEYDALKTR